MAARPAEASSTPEAERRQLTVLFCDLVDSTRLAAGMDPEDWRQVLRGYQESAAEVVERLEGHVAQMLGDGLLVYFGWPHAHEDDAERALRAGRDILLALEKLNERRSAGSGVHLSARIGVHTGPVVVGEVRGGARTETLALGDTTNVAARIQAAAEPDTVVASEATLDLVRGIFVTEELGRRALKGVVEPLLLHRVLQPAGVRSRLAVARSTWTHFVGREQELGLLLDRWEQAVEGYGQTVFLSGEAGMGKSRLALMLRERVGDRPHSWLECRSSPYTQGSALHPLIELVEQGLLMEPADPPEEKIRKLEESLVSGVELPRAVPLMADLLGIPTGDAYPSLRLSPELQRERTLETFVAWTLALAEIQPLMLLVEDLHWSDPSSLELFGRLIEQIPTSRVLMILTARPGFEVPWTNPKSWSPVTLGRLRRLPARELVRSLAGERSLPDDLVDQIGDRADGVPLYLEELTRAALESEEAGAAVFIPASLQDSLMARLDRLSSAKDVAQLASVLGREFSYRLLEAVAEMEAAALRAGLERLVDADILFRRGTPPEASYTFKHALLQEAAYEALLKTRRGEVHARTATVLEDAAAGGAHVESEVLARHFEASGAEDRAAEHFARAAEQAAARSAHREAIGHLRKVLALLERLPENQARFEQELAAQTLLGASLQATEGYTSAEGRAAYERARALCDVVKDPDRLAFNLWGLVAMHQTHGELVTATELSERLCAHAHASGKRLNEIMGHQILGLSLLLRGDPAARIHLEQAVALYDGSLSPALLAGIGQDTGMIARIYHAWMLWVHGEIDAAGAEGRAAVEAARKLEHPLTLAFVGSQGGVLFGMRQEWDLCRAFAEEAAQVSDRHGFPLWSGGSRIVQGWGRRGAAEEIQEGMALVGRTGNQALAPLILVTLADSSRAAGRDAEAVSAADLGLAIGERTKQYFWRSELLRHKGEASLQLEEHTESEAESLFRNAIEVARSQEAKTLELRAATSLARLWQRQGKGKAARALLRPVYDWFTEGFDTQDLKDAKALLEGLA